MSEGAREPGRRARVIHAIRILGFAEVDRLSDVTGLAADLVGEIVDELATNGLAIHRDGRIHGWMLTAEGREEAHRQIREHVVNAAEESSIVIEYPQFLALNGPFKEVCTRWQLDGQPAACVAELRRLHDGVSEVLARLTQQAPRFGQYRVRFDRTMARLESGDSSAFVQPLTESYHDLWMELHQDFLLSLGRERGESDGT